MDEFAESTLCQLLNKAVRVKEIMITSKEKHKASVQKIKERRNKLMIDMTYEVDGSAAQSEIEREIDSLDKKETQLHYDFKKILSSADTEINEIRNEIMRYRFGPSWNSDNTSANAQVNEQGAAQ